MQVIKLQGNHSLEYYQNQSIQAKEVCSCDKLDMREKMSKNNILLAQRVL